jgi:hypothetical protein
MLVRKALASSHWAFASFVSTAFLAVLGAPSSALAQGDDAPVSVPGPPDAGDDQGFKWDYKIKIESDLRFRLEDVHVGDWYGERRLDKGVERNQNTLGVRLNAKLDKFKAVGNVDLVLFGYNSKLDDIGQLTKSDSVQPYRFDVNELFLEADGLILDGLDLRIGQQVVAWGVADQFNPTNNLNPDDLRDPLLFGKQAGNFMVKADYYVTKDLSWSAVLVPLFRPALLPVSAALGPAAIDRLPFVNDQLRWRIEAERAATESKVLQAPTVVDKTLINGPPAKFENMQAAFRLAWTIADQDVALSYYNGRTDFPVPIANHTHQDTSFQGCDPKDKTRCATSLLKTDVTLAYPRMHVYGLNVAGEFNPFKGLKKDIPGIGYRFEGALIVPQKTTMTITQDALALTFPQPAGEYDYNGDGKPGGPRPLVVDDTPFFKWTLGLDYTFFEHLYVNAQWVHGLADEFGAGDWIFKGTSVRQSGITGTPENAIFACVLPKDGSKCAKEITRPRIGDFLVIGADYHFLDDAALARLFTIIELSGYHEESYDGNTGQRVRVAHPFWTPEGFSGAIFPEFDYNFGNGFELGLGALFLVGKPYTKFKDPASGGSLTFLRARYTL